MKLYSKGFTIIELTLTLMIVSIIAWILSEIIRAPLMTVVYNRQNSEICYLADLTVERLESSLRRAQVDTIQIHGDHELQFKDRDNQTISYQCRHQQMRRIINHQDHLIAPNHGCRFEVQRDRGYLQTRIWLTFMQDKETPVTFYREVNLRDDVE